MTLTATSRGASTVQRLGSGADAVLSAIELSIERATQPGQKLAERDKLWPGRLRLIGRAHLNLWGLSVFADLTLLLTELVTNAFQHGEGEEVGVRMARTAKTIRIEVADGSTRLPVARQASPLDESGRGIFIVDALADAWGVSHDG